MDTNLNEEMFTDYAMQILTAYMSEDDSVIESLMQTYSEKEWGNPAFMPGVMFGLIAHFKLLINSVSNMTDTDVDTVFIQYANAYALSRDALHDKFISPSRAEEMIKEWLKEQSEKN
jgi:hypothetical protein